jgi:hypothetical protein
MAKKAAKAEKQVVVTYRVKASKKGPRKKIYLAFCLWEDKDLARGTYADCMSKAKKHTLKTWHPTQVLED